MQNNVTVRFLKLYEIIVTTSNLYIFFFYVLVSISKHVCIMKYDML